MNRQVGFTLIELLVTIVVMVVVMTLGVPAFKETIRSNRLTTTVNDFISSLNLTRSEAIRRGLRVTLCKSTNGTSCDTSSTGYHQGWMIFIDLNNNATVDSGEEIIRVYNAIPSVQITGNSNVSNYISYTADGMTKLTGGGLQMGTLTVCIVPKAYEISISGAGRARTTEVTCS